MKIECILVDKKQGTYDHIKSIWTTLIRQSNISFFLTWGWIDNWINSLPEHIVIWFVVLYDDASPICAFFAGKNRQTRHIFFKSEELSLNTTGLYPFDNLCIEYNGIPCIDKRPEIFKEILDKLPFEWEEFRLQALDSITFPANILSQSIKPYLIIIDRIIPSFFVNLKRITSSSGDYISLLKGNVRHNINESYRSYKKVGKISVEIAHDLECALNIFKELITLHEAAWRSRGKRGAFNTEFFKSFHKNLIVNRFNEGEIQLIRVCVGQKTIGCLYNFVYDKKVLFYQSGFHYEAISKFRPGLITFVEAINSNVNLGNLEFDFLAGNARYKKDLSTDQRTMIWARIQKPCIKFNVEDKLINAKRCLMHLFKTKAKY